MDSESTAHVKPARTAAAVEANLQYAAERAIDNPVKLDRAARIVRTALQRKRLRLVDLDPTAVTEPVASHQEAA